MSVLHCSTVNFISVELCMSLFLTLLAPHLSLGVSSSASFLKESFWFTSCQTTTEICYVLLSFYLLYIFHRLTLFNWYGVR